MQVVIAEKPSLGRAIAAALGGQFDPVHQGDGKNRQVVGLRSSAITVTWAFGHILEMAPPEAYADRYKRWSVEDLPLRVDDWRLIEKVPQQVRAIAGLLKGASSCVNAGDPDREGQLLVDEILVHLNWRGKTLRLLPHATDPVSIKKAWSRMEPNEKYKPLYHAALCRQRADWMVGMNGSRGATLLLTEANQMVPVGRVMTPTLALVVRRDREIEAFTSRKFWKVLAVCEAASGQRVDLLHDPDPHIFDRKVAQALADGIKGAQVALKVKSEKAREMAPLPWHLGDFQRVMQKMLGVGLQDSLKILQSLYEKQLASYPRTDCRYMPKEQEGDALPILEATIDAALGEDAQRVRALRPDWKPKSYVYDNAKVAEHHGIVPTRKTPGGQMLDAKEMAAWRALVQHFAKTLLPHHEYEQSAISFAHKVEGGERTFLIKGRRSLNWDRSWRMFEERKDVALPGVKDGERARVIEVRLVEGKTTPPERYTESSLSADMEAIAKYVQDERIRGRLKETSGIGTAATRPAIVEKLKDRGMLVPQKRGKVEDLVSTPFGREVIDAMPAILVDPGLTAAWEEALEQVAKNQYDPAMFMERAQAMVARMVGKMKEPGGARIRSAAKAVPRAPAKAGRAASSRAGSAGKSAAGRKAPTS